MPNPNVTGPAPDLPKDWKRTFYAPAHPSNFWRETDQRYADGLKRTNVAICLHTPEEDVDDVEVTPWWFQQPNVGASTDFYVDSDGDLYQMVGLQHFAWAQGVKKRHLLLPRPVWWQDKFVSYNACVVSIEIEGRAASIGRTLTPETAQWTALVKLINHICGKYHIPRTRQYIVGHQELSSVKRDPGVQFPWQELMRALGLGPSYTPEMPVIPEHAHKISPPASWTKTGRVIAHD